MLLQLCIEALDYRLSTIDYALLTLRILDFKFWILDCFWYKLRPLWTEQISKTLLRRYRYVDAASVYDTLRERREDSQSKIPNLHPFMGAVNLKSKIQNLKLVDCRLFIMR